MTMVSPLFAALFLAAATPEEIPLWKDQVPGPALTDPRNVPTITVFRPEKLTGTAVVVCPGGGYGFLAVAHEGREVAEWLNQREVTAFVLKYRIVGKGPGKKDDPLWEKWPTAAAPLQPGPMFDVQRAIRFVRAKAKDYGIDPKRVGVWGFSAGGHLASTAATHFDNGKPDAVDPIDKESCRPDFAILAYPVITMGQSTHGGSRKNLIGDKPDPELAEFYSNEKQVTEKTPPTFIFHTAEDNLVPIANAKLFKEACDKHGVSCELVEYEKGQHGIGLALNHKELPASEWTQKLQAWMKDRKLLEQ